MKRDPIVEEIRKLREEYAARFDNDPNAIFEDIDDVKLRAERSL